MSEVSLQSGTSTPLAEWSSASSPPTGLLEQEWLDTNGLGDYASMTLASVPLRRYHGWLVARPEASSKRHVFLVQLEEHFARRGADGSLETIAAGTGTSEALREVVSLPWVRSRFEVAGATIEREVVMRSESPTVLVRYVVRGAPEGFVLRLDPWFACREADALTFENDVLEREAEWSGARLRFAPYEALPAVSLHLGGHGVEYQAEPTWRSVELTEEARRGYPDREDHFRPGQLVAAVAGDAEVFVSATIEPGAHDPVRLWRQECTRRDAQRRLAERHGKSARAHLAGEAFLYRDRGRRLGIMAGYPWFGEWGRDTFIALPGLTLGRGDAERCFEVLAGAVEYLQDGLVPNIYGLDRESSAYNSVDASLWFARAALLYHRRTGREGQVLRTLFPALLAIARAYRDGTSLGIHTDEGGLITAGSSSLNATWMDARLPEGPVTPRAGGRGRDQRALVFAAFAPGRAVRAGCIRRARALGRLARSRRRGVRRPSVDARRGAPGRRVERRSTRHLVASQHGPRRGAGEQPAVAGATAGGRRRGSARAPDALWSADVGPFGSALLWDLRRVARGAR